MRILAITSLILAAGAVAVSSCLCLEVLDGQKQTELMKRDIANLQRDA